MQSSWLDWIYPPKCGLCARLGPLALCEECVSDFKIYDARPTPGPSSVSLQLRMYRHEGRAAQAVRRLKYSRATNLVPPLAQLMRQGFENGEFLEVDKIIPIPIHWSRRSSRGFNQAEALCSALPADKVRTDLLFRTRKTRPQVGLSLDQRGRNLHGAFRADPRVGKNSILLVDDVTTTGHTAEQCAIALLEAGATSVSLLTLTGED